MSGCYCDFDQYMAHVQQMAHIRPRVVTTTTSAFASQWYQGIYSRVKKLLSSVCSQDVITCFTSASIPITCQPGASQGSVRDKTLSARLGLIHNLSDVQP